MYPVIEIASWFHIYTFGIGITVSFFLFLWMLKRLSRRFGVNESFFLNRILWYFLSIIIFSRLFYIIANWNTQRYLRRPVEFFIVNDYNFSLLGALFGFFLVLYLTVIAKGLRSAKYIDISMLSFLFAGVVGYIGAFFGGVIYGKETNFGMEVLYNNTLSPVPFETPVFPLALFYALMLFLLFSVLYMLAMFVSVRGIIGYIAMICLGGIYLFGEEFSGKVDTIQEVLGVLNFNQLGAIGLIFLGFVGLYRIYKTPTKTEVIG